MSSDRTDINIFIDSIEFMRQTEKQLALKLGLPGLHSGVQTIRNEKGWRENEKEIEYIWLVRIDRSLAGWGGLFTIKFNENKFREYDNPNELVQGLFIYNQHGISEIYTNTLKDTTDEALAVFNFNLFEARKGITLDGVSYKIRIITNSIDTYIQLNNPNTADWKKWENVIWKTGKQLAKKSGSQEMIELFE